MSLLDFADLHGLVDSERGITNRGAFRRGGMASYDFIFAGIAAALNFVGVAVAFWLGHSQRAGGDEFVDAGAVGIQSQIAAFRLRDLEKVSADSGETDSLRGRGAGVGCGHFFCGEIENAERDSHKHEDANEFAHEASLRLKRNIDKILRSGGCERDNLNGRYSWRSAAIGSDFAALLAGM